MSKAIFFTLFFLLSCRPVITTSNKEKTVEKIINHIKRNDANAIRELIGDGLLIKDDYEGLVFYVDKTHDLFEKYGVQSNKEWYTEYDTVRPIYKLETIVVPIYSGYDETNRLEEASLEIGFDYSGLYLPDTLIAHFKLKTKFRPRKRNQ